MLPFPEVPAVLADRLLPLNAQKPKDDGEFVLCWLHHALRLEENPALLWAARCADAWDKPLLVYQGLFGENPYNNQRHLTFILQGAKDFATQCRQANLSYVFALPEKSFAEASPLPQLAARAAAVITELWPLTPLRGYSENLAARVSLPVHAVDCATVVPMRYTHKAFSRAFAFREHIAKEWPRRLELTWPLLPKVLKFHGDLPFTPLLVEDLDDQQLTERLWHLDADHSVPPVADTVGGSKAGKERWQAFKRKKLALYHRDRNDAAKPQAVSRLSAYLHYGMLSATTLAREAWLLGGEGAEKYLDELIIWRDLAYQFCYHQRDLAFNKALPEWARDTLQKQAASRRAPKNLEDLLRAQSGDALWDAAQQSLLWHGELHNNLRMTWGKAIVEWAPSPELAYDWLQELNHRFALDGSDPNSYGGILWCLGQFDRPFPPAKAIWGTLRPRATAEHQKRLDVTSYHHWLRSPLLRPRPQARVAIIGAGLSGLWAARSLQDQGIQVALFEKANRPGGRACSRRFAGTLVDHGAAFLTARSSYLKPWYQAWQQRGLLAPFAGEVLQWEAEAENLSPSTTASAKKPSANFWQLPAEHRQKSSEKSQCLPPGLKAYTQPRQRFLPKPAFQSLAEHLALDLTVHYQQSIQMLTRQGAHWQLTAETGKVFDGFDGVLLAVLPSQAEALLQAHYPQWQSALGAATLTPTWVVGLHLEAALLLPASSIFFRQHPIFAWAAQANAQDGRGDQEIWLLHANADWSARHLDAPPEQVLDCLTEAWRDFLQSLGETLPAVRESFSKRWRYAQVRQTQALLTDRENFLAVGGDWLYGGRVESAFLAGAALAGFALQMAMPADLAAASG